MKPKKISPTSRLPLPLALISRNLPPILVTLIWILPTGLTMASYDVITTHLSGWERYLSFFLVPLIFVFSFIGIAGTFSRIGVSGILEGKFPRRSDHPVYARRRIYGATWTQVYYFKPLYALCLAVPLLKRYLLRSFGYKGDLDFTVYPDTWIRDLPLLKISKNVYISNRATVGTNICLNDGSIFVGPCTMMEGALIGHLTMLAPGTLMEKESELGLGSVLGLRSQIGSQSSSGVDTTIHHGVIIKEKTSIGHRSFIGLRVKLGPSLTLPPALSIPGGTILNTQEEVDEFVRNQIQDLNTLKKEIFSSIRKEINTNLVT